jgi:DNA-binding NtrC family response regulator
MMGTYQPAAILVVDDDYSIRQCTCLLLKRITGATVLEAGTPRASLRIAQTNEKTVTLLISDIDLRADIDGVQLANEIVAMSPETKVVLMSGNHAQRPDLRPEWRFIRKPFALVELIDTVNSLFESGRSPFSTVPGFQPAYSTHAAQAAGSSARFTTSSIKRT